MLTDSITLLLEKVESGFQKLKFLLLRVVVVVLAVQLSLNRGHSTFAYLQARY